MAIVPKKQTIHQQTTDALAALIRQRRIVAALLCAACGATGQFYADDGTLYCAACWCRLEEIGDA